MDCRNVVITIRNTARARCVTNSNVAIWAQVHGALNSASKQQRILHGSGARLLVPFYGSETHIRDYLFSS